VETETLPKNIPLPQPDGWNLYVMAAAIASRAILPAMIGRRTLMAGLSGAAVGFPATAQPAMPGADRLVE
jgi:hypothetical protein